MNTFVLKLLLILMASLLTACQTASLAPQTASSPPEPIPLKAPPQSQEPVEPTRLEQILSAKPAPKGKAALQAECAAMAELYSSSFVAHATWEYAKTPQKPPRAELAGAMRAAQARAERLGCPAFWRE